MKRFNPFAVALWAIAAIYLVGNLIGLFMQDDATVQILVAKLNLPDAAFADRLTHLLASSRTLGDVLSILFGTAQLAAFGAIVELLSRIHARLDNSAPRV